MEELRHGSQEISVENLIASLDVEEKARAKDIADCTGQMRTRLSKNARAFSSLIMASPSQGLSVSVRLSHSQRTLRAKPCRLRST